VANGSIHSCAHLQKDQRLNAPSGEFDLRTRGRRVSEDPITIGHEVQRPIDEPEVNNWTAEQGVCKRLPRGPPVIAAVVLPTGVYAPHPVGYGGREHQPTQDRAREGAGDGDTGPGTPAIDGFVQPFRRAGEHRIGVKGIFRHGAKL